MGALCAARECGSVSKRRREGEEKDRGRAGQPTLKADMAGFNKRRGGRGREGRKVWEWEGGKEGRTDERRDQKRCSQRREWERELPSLLPSFPFCSHHHLVDCMMGASLVGS